MQRVGLIEVRCRHGSGSACLRHPRHPIVGVTWDNAEHYVAWLSKQTGKTYRRLGLKGNAAASCTGRGVKVSAPSPSSAPNDAWRQAHLAMLERPGKDAWPHCDDCAHTAMVKPRDFAERHGLDVLTPHDTRRA